MKFISKLIFASALTLSSASLTLAYASDAHHESKTAAEPKQASATSGVEQTNSASQSSANAASMSEGEIRKVDKDAGKVTIKHGPLKNLDMPAMTMVFRVKDSAMLEQAKAGDKINFVADKIGGQYTVIQIESKQQLAN